MKGADVLFGTLAKAGVDVCFTNPGTSEMHMVAALDRLPSIRPVLCLFEGVVTGAADGYFRMTGKPAATLLHLGPGLANGLANLHNAGKAGSAIINVVGEHATAHLAHEAPLTSDIDAIARPVCYKVIRIDSPSDVAVKTIEAVDSASNKAVVALIITADATWSDAVQGQEEDQRRTVPSENGVEAADFGTAISALETHGKNALILLGGSALLGDSAQWAVGLAQHFGCRVAARSLSARMDRGGDQPAIERIPFEINAAIDYLKDVSSLVTIGAPVPISFFAYPGKPSVLIDPKCQVIALSEGGDPRETLLGLAKAAGARRASAPTGTAPVLNDHSPLDAAGIGVAIAATLPENSVLIDESITAAPAIYSATANAAAHSWLNNMGGAIGFALPLAIGTAVGAPDRRTVAMIGDGSALYTEQGLWTLAREQLDVTVLILANRAYAVLRNEWRRMGVGEEGSVARDMLALDRPTIDFVAIAEGHGVDAVRVETVGELSAALRKSYARRGPMLIEAVIEPH